MSYIADSALWQHFIFEQGVMIGHLAEAYIEESSTQGPLGPDHHIQSGGQHGNT